jgi:hypothetical protein
MAPRKTTTAVFLFNGDGFSDIVIGAVGAAFNGRIFSGAAYVVFGRAQGISNIDLATISSQWFRIETGLEEESLGISFAAAGDVNGDGFGDLIIGASAADPSFRPNAGSSFLLFGRASGFGDIQLNALTSDQGFRIDGAAGHGGSDAVQIAVLENLPMLSVTDFSII